MSDVRWNLPPNYDPGEEIGVGPVEAESAGDVLWRLEQAEMAKRPLPPEPARGEPTKNLFDYIPAPSAEDLPQFTLSQLFVAMTAIGVWCGILRALSLLKMPVLAGLTGAAALGGLLWIAMQDRVPAIAKLTWWLLAIVYIICTIASFLF